jgi:hypothetical protein
LYPTSDLWAETHSGYDMRHNRFPFCAAVRCSLLGGRVTYVVYMEPTDSVIELAGQRRQSSGWHSK